MRKLPYHLGTEYEPKPVEDPWRRRMPAQIYIGSETPRRVLPLPRPLTFGKRCVKPDTIVTTRRLSFASLRSWFQGPKKTKRTKLR